MSYSKVPFDVAGLKSLEHRRDDFSKSFFPEHFLADFLSLHLLSSPPDTPVMAGVKPYT